MKASSKKVLSVLLALVMVVSMMSMSALATTTTYHGVEIQFGDPDYPATWPESLMTLQNSTGTTYNAVYTGTDSASYYPDILSLTAYTNANDQSSTVSLEAIDSTVKFMTYDADGEHEKSTISYSTNANLNTSGQMVNSNVFTIKLTGAGDVAVKDNGTTKLTIHFSSPMNSVATGGTTPAYVNGYLPLGQYASGSAWGSIFSNYTNINGTAEGVTDANTKIVGGADSTGISLGAPGGYVQVEFSGNGVENAATNKYGIDFVVYGNPFNGNPEAGSVKVYGNIRGTNNYGWYELAGSRYYNSETMHNVDLKYTLKSDGIYYTLGDGAETLFKATTAWWPTAAEGYETVDGVGALFQGNTTVTDVEYGTDADGNPTITYKKLNLVKDTDTTDDYLFGYADVRAVGSKDGTAINPYASVPTSGGGGDGFDISWAVDTNGNPVDLQYVKYVRIYTSAGLDPNNLTALPTPSIFGETSTEVCGVFAAKESGSGSAVAPTITIDGEEIGSLEGVGATPTTISDNQQILTITGLDNYSTEFALEVEGGTYVFMNGVATNSTDIVLGDGETLVQIISQSGTAEPFITLVKLSA